MPSKRTRRQRGPRSPRRTAEPHSDAAAALPPGVRPRPWGVVAAAAVVCVALVGMALRDSRTDADQGPAPAADPTVGATNDEAVAAPPPGTIVATYPHDPQAFTQGLFVHEGSLYESTGLYGPSVVRRVDAATGAAVAETQLAKELFGEGSTVWGDSILMLTWKEHVALTFDVDTLRLRGTAPFATTTGQGWGITSDVAGGRLIVSDGSSFLHFWDPAALPEIRELSPRVQVLDEQGAPVEKLNELEFINGEVYANVWYKDFILRIDPDTGRVKGRLNFDGLIQPFVKAARQRRVDCLNGIAWNASDPGHILITGKWWPKMFKVAI